MAVFKNRYVEISLDQPRRLRYTINAVREIEAAFGGGIASIFDSKRLGWDHVTTLIYFGLKHGDPDAFKKYSTMDKLADLLQKHWIDTDKGGLKELIEIAMEGMKAGGIISAEVADEEEEAKVPADDPLASS